jgi:hypothetical protein
MLEKEKKDISFSVTNYVDLKWTELAADRSQEWALVSDVMNLPVTTLRAMHVCRGSNGKFLLRRSCL